MPDFTTEQVCPENLSQTVDQLDNAYPDGWYIRIMFDELLDPEVETLTEILDEDGNPTDTYVGSIASTQPVTLLCESVNGGMVTVDYDGYYSPSGNRQTWPVGPSLVIKPNDPTLIGTGSMCEVRINDTVQDKSGNPVPADQRGPYRFSVAPIQVLLIEPADDPDGDHPVTATSIWFDNVYVQFNTEVDSGSWCDEGADEDECEFEYVPDPGGSDFFPLVLIGLTPAEYAFYPLEPVMTEADYTFRFIQGTTIADRCGNETTFGAPSAADNTLIRFTTDAFKLGSANIVTGETATALKKLKVTFTNVLDGAEAPEEPIPATAIAPAGWTLDPMPFDEDATTPLTNATAAISAPDASGQFFVQGHYELNKTYTFTLKAGTVVTDYHGATYTQPTDLTISWKTQPALTAAFTADNSVFTKASAASLTGVTLTFNNAIDGPTTALTPDTEFTVTGPGGAAVTGWTIAPQTANDCTVLGTACRIRIRKNLPAGDYTFTLKAGATVSDVFGVVYTQAADRVINFTVKDPPPPTPDCL